MDAVEDARRRVAEFGAWAHDLIAKHETSKASRVITLSQTRDKLQGLSLRQESLFEDSLLCIQQGLYRAAHVMAWAGFMDFLEEKLVSDGLAAVHTAYPRWKAFKSVEALRENIVEYQLLDAAQKVGLTTKTPTKALHGLLAKRNECAHPSGYEPGLNEALGYVSELLERVRSLQPKTL
ncbi:MAG TPA: hypothetical protein VGN09_13420 [Vicinamibacteria bacterium]